MRAFGQRHDHFEPSELATGHEGREFGTRVLFQRDAQAAHLQAIGIVDHDQVGPGLALGHADIFPRFEGFRGGILNRVDIRIAPGFVFPGWKEYGFCHYASAITAS